MEILISGILSAFGGISSIITGNQNARYSRLPQWADPRDYQRTNNSAIWIIVGLIAAFLTIVISIAIVASRKKK